mgnify:CR=1 FL=1
MCMMARGLSPQPTVRESASLRIPLAVTAQGSGIDILDLSTLRLTRHGRLTNDVEPENNGAKASYSRTPSYLQRVAK